MRKLRTLIGMPVVVQNRRIGRVVQAALSEDLTSLDGLWVDEGLRGTRLIPSESLEMLGRIAVVADEPGKRKKGRAGGLFFRAGAVHGLLGRSALRARAGAPIHLEPGKRRRSGGRGRDGKGGRNR